MTKLTRDRIRMILFLFVASFLIMYFADRLSILTTCIRDPQIHCDQFYKNYPGHFNDYEGYYSEYRDIKYWLLGAVTIVLAGIPFLILIALDIHKNKFKSSLQIVKLNQSEIGDDVKKKEEKLEIDNKRRWW